MRSCILLLLVFGCAGCTHQALARRTINQGSTLTDLQYQQILDNAAMFACNADSLPWHLKLSGGSVQVSDQGSALFTEVLVNAKPGTYSKTLSAQRGVVNQWAVIPTVDADNLSALALAYRKAVDPVDADGQLRQAIYAKIAETSVLFNVVLTRDTLDKVIDMSGRLDEVKRANLKRKNEELHERLDQTFDRAARLSQPVTEDQIDNFAKRLYGRITDETRGEARVKAQQQQERDRVTVSQARVGVEDEIVRLTRELCNLPYVPRYPVTGRADHNPRSTELAEKQIAVLLDLVEKPEFQTCWLATAKCRTDLPHCACYVGHFCKCGCTCYAAVTPEHAGTLRDFALAILTLAPITAQESGSSITAGNISYSPTLATGR